MTPDQQQELLDLHSEAVRLNVESAHNGRHWRDAHAADRAFTDALAAMVTP
jgi:hypothetical protein